MHGDKDQRVPLEQSELLAAALKKAGVEVSLVVVKGNGHGGPGFNGPEKRKLIEKFFAKQLGKGQRDQGGRAVVRRFPLAAKEIEARRALGFRENRGLRWLHQPTGRRRSWDSTDWC